MSGVHAEVCTLKLHALKHQNQASSALFFAFLKDISYNTECSQAAALRHLLTPCWVMQLIEGAEVKALYGLTLNYKPLEALVQRLLRDTTLSGEQVADLLNDAGVIPFPDPFVEGFKWDDNGRLVYPGMPDEVCSAAGCKL